MQSQNLTRVEFDDRGRRTTFDEIEVGKDLGRMEWVVDEQEVIRWADANDDLDPWWLRDSPFGGRIAPTGALFVAPRILFSSNYNVRGVFAKGLEEFLQPVKVGSRVTVGGRVARKYVKRDREFVTWEGWMSNDRGEVVYRTRRTHAIDFIKRSVRRAGKGLDSNIYLGSDGKVLKTQEKDPDRQLTVRIPDNDPRWSQVLRITPATRAVEHGFELPPLVEVMTLEKFIKWEPRGLPEKNIHTDQAAAEREGLPGPVAAGPTVASLIHKQMRAFFGEGWLNGGVIDLTIAKSVFHHDRITARAYVMEKIEEAGKLRIVCDVWCENQKGDTVIFGTASGVVK